MAKLQKRKRKLGECPTRKQAIRNFCLECVGYEIAEVHRCTAVECWLHPYRPGATKEELKTEKQLTKEQKELKDAKPVEQTFSLRE
jgi:hypothetical protein